MAGVHSGCARGLTYVHSLDQWTLSLTTSAASESTQHRRNTSFEKGFEGRRLERRRLASRQRSLSPGKRVVSSKEARVWLIQEQATSSGATLSS